MLKKLRLKFVALNMATVAVVLAVVFTAICVIDHQQSVARVQEALDAAVAHAGRSAAETTWAGRLPLARRAKARPRPRSAASGAGRTRQPP